MMTKVTGFTVMAQTMALLVVKFQVWAFKIRKIISKQILWKFIFFLKLKNVEPPISQPFVIRKLFHKLFISKIILIKKKCIYYY